jgi:hypothetical protein
VSPALQLHHTCTPICKPRAMDSVPSFCQSTILSINDRSYRRISCCNTFIMHEKLRSPRSRNANAARTRSPDIRAAAACVCIQLLLARSRSADRSQCNYKLGLPLLDLDDNLAGRSCSLIMIV